MKLDLITVEEFDRDTMAHENRRTMKDVNHSSPLSTDLNSVFSRGGAARVELTFDGTDD